MERKFDVKLENKNDYDISVRFYSQQKLELWVKNIKAFYKDRQSDSYNCGIVAVFLDNDARIKTFTFPKAIEMYNYLNFIIKDKTNKVQYAVQIPLKGTEAKYTKMIYEEA